MGLKEAKEKAEKKISSVREKVKSTGKKVMIFVKENKEICAALITAVGKLGYEAYRMHNRKAEFKAERRENQTRIKDEVTGRTYYIDRPMTKEEEAEFNAAFRSIERSGSNCTSYDILKEMDLL